MVPAATARPPSSLASSCHWSERRARLSLSCVVECGDPNLTELVDRQGALATWTQLVDGRMAAEAATVCTRRDESWPLGQSESAESKARRRCWIPPDR